MSDKKKSDKPKKSSDNSGFQEALIEPYVMIGVIIAGLIMLGFVIWRIFWET